MTGSGYGRSGHPEGRRKKRSLIISQIQCGVIKGNKPIRGREVIKGENSREDEIYNQTSLR